MDTTGQAAGGPTLSATRIANGMSEAPFDANRYDGRMQYRRCGRSGLLLPAISLGGWETYGGYRGAELARAVLFRAFDLGITHFDFANNYGKPPGNSELVCGPIIKQMPRDELIISSKAGWRMWPGPYGDLLSRKYIIASCDQSLARMGLEYFDIFYLHRTDPETPLEESLGAIETLIRQGKALYGGVSAFSGAHFADAVRIGQAKGYFPITIHQPAYNMLNRGIEGDLLPQTERAGRGEEQTRKRITPERLEQIRQLNEMAKARGQTLAQMALAWILRLPAVTSALIGASKVEQVEENVKALANLAFSAEELACIDSLTKGRP
jgi:L-glyceraldehyde 3-phosphate reductase